MEKTLNAVEVPVDLTNILSGITGDLILEPVSKPIEEAEKVIEIVGLCIAVVTLQPGLALACAKALVHDEIKTVINKAIDSLIESVTSANATADEGAQDTDSRDIDREEAE